ncbi:ATP-binding cassette domain-containing protein [Marinobacterium sp. xm-a-152]|uniref:ATP-binding cassette domain-containing protein n=1 Tax=Marinobacterium sp. xm-a-152 TaxID=2497733 RepID=UPI00156A2985|nr:ATP-binding cassette domain-containing protein [Marinobacterium sp. xm-a-152]NRP16361.1 Toxin RTX-I translocation ATP-binding protein [Marinobacterium sp. xm-a-152]
MTTNFSLLFSRAAKLGKQSIALDRLEQIENFLVDQDHIKSPVAIIQEGWTLAQLDGTPKAILRPKPSNLPFILFKENEWFIVEAQLDPTNWRAISVETGQPTALTLEGSSAISIPHRSNQSKTTPSALGVVWREVFKHKPVFFSSFLATGLVSVLALATSLYAMQVYDRVIPNVGFETLKVLTVGVAISILLEWVLKLIRSHLVDSTGNEVDDAMSKWFFDRMLGVRMEARPQSVGTLASQVKGFEMVRGVLASTTLFALADVPFSLLFLLVIYAVGGPIVILPLIFIPLALIVGLIFQRLVHQHTHLKLATSNQKAGLLVETVDGAEALKAMGAEWAMQSRWNKLVAEAGLSELKMRRYTAFSQNSTAALQQLAYIAIISSGAYLATQNELTMGGLLACSIIGNRAMQPIIQLPGAMMQWALAKAALKGLDQIIDLPNEADEQHEALLPEKLASNYHLERCKFAYGATSQMVLDIERLDIAAGEAVGLVGPIGSGKSTLLKLLSGLYRPLEGKVQVGGIDMAALNALVLTKQIGYLPQDPKLFSGTLRYNLLLGLPDPGEEKILEAAKRTGLASLIVGQPAGLDLPITEGGKGVSGGQRQLIALTRILLANPKVLLLDEPTGPMDSVTEVKVVQLLKELSQEGVTLIVTTHKTALLSIFSRIVVVQGGRVQLDGPRDEVVAKLTGKTQSASAEQKAN